MTSVLTANNVEFSYPGSPVPQVRLVHFEMGVGEKVFLYGPSGSGKTTLLELLAGVLRPQKGELRILGREMAELSGPELDLFRADHVGYIFQSFNLIPYLNVRENVLLPLSFSEKKRAKVPRPEEEARRLLQALGMVDLISRPVNRLSVGQQQRVAAARALLGQPELLLADEPTSALDFDHRQKFLKLLFELASTSRTAILFVSHDRTLEGLFDRAVAFSSVSRGES